ncbi:hypothetical protein A2160_01035 [Candidatus Beckwithbacteria bacterium RBG_13_42_9]|uniref:Two component regulator three Y domain-containing protein n=1 Tax=Candidatus Beckwithbacteria bacterium RBG_13_42_9 TaxID=1797457 RepID=A0A1F5E8D3_9BACT|nr:MAG: hypothetical protein A2160_01035 [Candidatus Beckwithbacteria bacterium RBG_13_42_9]
MIEASISIDPSQKPPIGETISPQAPKPPLKIWKWLVIFVSIVGLALVLAYLVMGWQKQKFGSSPITFLKSEMGLAGSPKPESLTPTGMKQWVNCDDVRKVIEDQDKLYVACLGGVLIVNKNSGQVVDQISLTQGLSNSTTTDLVKKGGKLYIGTQDGFTIFDLAAKTAQKFSVAQGLSNGANITLADDGQYLWVGTFDGVNRYNYQTEEIQSYKSELADGTKFSVVRLLVTPKAVYALLPANAYTPGSVARFDKATGIWEKFGPSAFLSQTNQHSRIDMSSLGLFANQVLVGDDHHLWQAEDKAGAVWLPLPEIETQLSNQEKLPIAIINGQSKSYIEADKKAYAYDPEAKKITLAYPQDETNNLLATASNSLPKVDGDKVWAFPFAGSDNQWLKWLELGTWRSGGLNLKGRPISFGKLMLLIDDQPVFLNFEGLWQYSQEKQEFKNLIKDTGLTSIENLGGQATFQPLPNTSKIFMFWQSCGMVCNPPRFGLFDYQTREVQWLNFSQTLDQKLKGEGAHEGELSLFYKSFYEPKGEFLFSLNNKKVILNISTWEWAFTQEDAVPTPGSYLMGHCNPAYKFTTNGNKFDSFTCPENVENSDYAWFVKTTDSNNSELWQGKRTEREPKPIKLFLAPMEYSPFNTGDQDSYQISKLTYSHGYLWVATNRGLVAYKPEDESTRLFSAKEGLISPKVASFLIGSNRTVWVQTEWGGLTKTSY